MTDKATADTVPANEVRLVGRVSGTPQEKELPSGDRLWSFRIVVPRTQPMGRQTVDALECVAWSARTRRSVAGWAAGDTVELSGALRRRFYRAGPTTVSRVEVEALRARLIRRATSA